MIRSIELFVVDNMNNDIMSMYSSSAKWSELYRKNKFYLQDHIVYVSAHNDIEFLVWDHLGTNPNSTLINANRKKILDVNNGVTFSVNFEEKKLICLLGVQAVPFEDYILLHKKQLREFAHAIFFTYCMSSDDELQRYIQKLPCFSQSAQRI